MWPIFPKFFGKPGQNFEKLGHNIKKPGHIFEILGHIFGKPGHNLGKQSNIFSRLFLISGHFLVKIPLSASKNHLIPKVLLVS